MSYGLTLYRFVDGEMSRVDIETVRPLLAAYDAAPGRAAEDSPEFWVRAPDGSEAEVSVSDGIIAVERPQAGEVWKVVIGLINQTGTGVLLADGRFLCPDGMREHLPAGMADDSVFVPEITLETLERIAGPFTHPLA
ncbi:hypothetical protein [Streptomyces formicae]|uniref:Uncharacterized protein n=1 Tax=Streptomyces formicae TaxID=1616117 RepID=A0A291Q841_9ACTN|nr:hypothetical protein [Streptomyces formicae]ATL27643.1 hypothetical protein KY5_2625 [Streptomyces formicae]